MSEEKKKTLKRTFGMREAVTITVGTVVGVGLFTTGANVVGDLGPAVILATLVAMLISIYPSLLYAEMGAALPYAGGTYQYASLGIGKPFGMLAGWNFIISLVSVTSGEALAFSFYFKTFFSALGIELPVSDTVVATLIVLVFIVTNVRGIEMTGKLQNGFMFFFWGVAIIWFLMMLPNVNMPNFVNMPDFIAKSTPLSFIASVSMIWWCFAGFETCCAMGEEIKYPQINIPRALILAPFIVFAVNSAFQWFLVGIVPISEISSLATASAPFAEAMKTARNSWISAGTLGSRNCLWWRLLYFKCKYCSSAEIFIYNVTRWCNAKSFCKSTSKISDPVCVNHRTWIAFCIFDCIKFYDLHCFFEFVCRFVLLRHRNYRIIMLKKKASGTQTSV